jgi:nicotinate-nucleotide pyrophosphorylase/quinolinate synthetase A subunit
MRDIIDLALQEDLRDIGDVTSSAIFTDETADFLLISKGSGILCGRATAEAVLKRVDPSITAVFIKQDGAQLEAGTIAAKISGPVVSILTAERTMLNFLSHLSGIATKTRRYAEAAAPAVILDTRKTIPGMRELEKYAVTCGGGKNHRMGLFDMVMIKDNHIDAAGGITKAVEAVRNTWKDQFSIEVEARTIEEAEEAAACKADRILLDNMSTEMMREAVLRIAGAAETEASGNVTLERVAEIASTGVDFISAGSLTHTVEAFDFSLKKAPLPRSSSSASISAAERIQEAESEESIVEQIRRVRKQLGERVLIPVHHYQRPEIAAVADIIGDSYKLAVDVSRSSAEYILFCGVRFMAEGAAVLAGPRQKVVMPEPAAGCPMADMITAEEAEAALNSIEDLTGTRPVPIVYMNAYADMKALCGRNGGSVCTSSNAARIMEYYLRQNRPIFFAPDWCLGSNTAAQLGIPKSRIASVRRNGTVETGESSSDTRLYLWDGNCSVHQYFTASQAETMRKAHPGITVIVHPEVPPLTAAAADLTGSTQDIYNRIREAPPGSSWAVGTEYSFVTRMASEFPDKEIYPLCTSVCRDMEMTTPEKLLALLQSIAEGTLEREYADHIITVSEKIRTDAAAALNTMIAIVQESSR